MRLIETRLVNFGCFEDEIVSWHPGLNAVTGPIGAGKTTLLEGTLFALTGLLRSTASALDFLRPGTDKAAYAEVTVEVDGVRAVFRRNLRPTDKPRHRLEAPHGVFTKERDVAAAGEALLGAPARVLAEYAFVGQWQVFSFLTADPAERAATLAHLLGIRRMERLSELCREAEPKLVSTSTAVETARLRVSVEELRGQESELSRRLEGLPVVPDEFDPLYCPQAAIVRRWECQEASRRRYEALMATQQRLAAAAAQTALDYLERAADLSALEDAIDEAIVVGGDLARRRQDVEAWRRKEVLRREASRLEAAIVDLGPPPHQPTRPRPDKKVLMDMAAEKTSLLRYLDGLPPRGSRCPTCGSDADTFADKVTSARSRLVELEPILAEGLASSSDWDRYESLAMRRETRWRDLDDRRRAVLREESSLKPFGGSLSEAEQVATTMESLLSRATSTRAEVAAARRRADEAEEAHRHGLLDLETVGGAPSTDRESASVSREDYLVAREELDRLTTVWPIRRELTIRLSVVRERLSQSEARLHELEAAAVVERQRETALGLLRSCRALFHHSVLQRDVALAYRDRLATLTNDTLRSMGVAFSTSLSEDMALLTRGTDGRERDARRLSGGEKVLLALAFRVAVHSLFARGLGLLALDEPTAGLDGENLKCLELAIESLRRLTSSSGLQVIVVTHEPVLDRLCDHAVRLTTKR